MKTYGLIALGLLIILGANSISQYSKSMEKVLVINPEINSTTTNNYYNITGGAGKNTSSTDPYLSNDTSTIFFDESYLNGTIDARASGGEPLWSGNYTACPPGNHLYFDGSDLACEADAIGGGGEGMWIDGGDYIYPNTSFADDVEVSNLNVSGITNLSGDIYVPEGVRIYLGDGGNQISHQDGMGISIGDPWEYDTTVSIHGLLDPANFQSSGYVHAEGNMSSNEDFYASSEKNEPHNAAFWIQRRGSGRADILFQKYNNINFSMHTDCVLETSANGNLTCGTDDDNPEPGDVDWTDLTDEIASSNINSTASIRSYDQYLCYNASLCWRLFVNESGYLKGEDV